MNHKLKLRSFLLDLNYFIMKRFNIDSTNASSMHTFRSQLFTVLKHGRINNVFDVGANTGQFGRALRKVGYKGAIHSFEPVNVAFEALEIASASDLSWYCYNIALADRNESGEINVPSKSLDFASILEPNEFGLKKFKGMRADETQPIVLRRLDDFVNEIEVVGDNWLLKIDTQGYDMQVFSGAEKIRKRIQYLITELSIDPIYNGMTNYLEALTEFGKFGFLPIGFFPVSRNVDLSLIEVDCFLVNSQYQK